MPLTCTNFDKLFGVYRGTVLKHLPHGRCKIFIPAAYHDDFKDKPDALPSAEQAAPLFAGVNAGNGVFSYPNIGATVLCLFLNGDVNLPIYFAATLAGENAFGQYTIIKKDLKEENGEEIDSKERVSERHLVTSGKTHIEWFENGKLSAIVEDPIRTICSVDYDSWEKSGDNISADDKYESTLSNDNVWKIRDDELSNIDCQLVLDNNGKTHGYLSTSTHWYDIIDKEDKKKKSEENGIISTDNWHIMNNDGVIKFGTLSTKCIAYKDTKGKTDTDLSVNNAYKLCVPGVMDHKVFYDGTIAKTNNQKKSKERDQLSSISKEHHDISANIWLKSYRDQTSSYVDDSKSTNITSILSNNFSMLSDGLLALSSNRIYNNISANTDTGNSKIRNRNVSAVISAGTNGNSKMCTISTLTSINNGDSTAVSVVNLSNQIDMDKDGKVFVHTGIDKIETDDSIQTKIDGYSKVLLDVDGMHESKSKWHYFRSADDNTQDIDNNFVFVAENRRSAILKEKVTSEKRDNDSKSVDFKYFRKVDAQNSTVDISIADDIAENEAVYLNDLSKGTTTLQIKSTASGNKCTIVIDVFGKMTITTDDKLDIKTTNSVTVTSSQITMNGPTTINGTLHVTDATTIDADASIGTISFLGHFHTGNVGAPTSPPIG